MEILVLCIAFCASIVGTICGIGGGMVGRKLNKKRNTAMVDNLFAELILMIIGISCYNVWRFL